MGVIVLVDTKNLLIPPGSGIVGPQIFPNLVGIFLLIVSIGIFIQIFRGNLGQPEGTEFGDLVEKTDFKSLLMVAGSMMTYPVLIERAGFFVASSVAFFGVSYAFGAKNIKKNLTISIIFSAIVYFSFTRGLNVSLPSGILGGI